MNSRNARHGQVAQLRLIFEQAEAKKQVLAFKPLVLLPLSTRNGSTVNSSCQEREWLRNQQQGDLDDMRLVDAITGRPLA